MKYVGGLSSIVFEESFFIMKRPLRTKKVLYDDIEYIDISLPTLPGTHLYTEYIVIKVKIKYKKVKTSLRFMELDSKKLEDLISFLTRNNIKMNISCFDYSGRSDSIG